MKQKSFIADYSAMPARLLIMLFIAAGLWLRAVHLDSPGLWVDEAESAINALSILEHGYPADHYLGLPLFENTLIKPWPDSEEYEFRDLSYSERGVAAYHSWLPLYAMAASLYVAGIEPDQPQLVPKVRHERAAAPVRTLAPRIPAILFSLVFLLSIYLLAETLYNRDAAFAALAAAAITDGFVNYGRYARYYSATFALTTLCVLAIWRLKRHRRWFDVIFAAIVFVLLFHSHTLSFLVMTMVLTITMLSALIRQRLWTKGLALIIIVSLGTVPWALSTGYLEATFSIPKAWTLLDFPADLLRFPRRETTIVLPVLLGLLWLLISRIYAARLPAALSRPFSGYGENFLLLVLWGGIGFLSFLFLIPAASFFESRLNLMVAVPGIVLFAMVIAAVSRILSQRYSRLLSIVIMVITLFLSGNISFEHAFSAAANNRYLDTIYLLRQVQFSPATRFYSVPNQHLILTYYSGLPVQSIAPVRKSFLDQADNDIIFIDPLSSDNYALNAALADVRTLGIKLTETQMRYHLERLGLAIIQERVETQVKKLWPSKITLSRLEQRLRPLQDAHMTRLLRDDAINAPVLRGYDLRYWEDWWQIFVYRFSDVERRRLMPNYAGLLRRSTALILPWGWVIYDSSRAGTGIFADEEKLHDFYQKSCAVYRSLQPESLKNSALVCESFL